MTSGTYPRIPAARTWTRETGMALSGRRGRRSARAVRPAQSLLGSASASTIDRLPDDARVTGMSGRASPFAATHTSCRPAARRRCKQSTSPSSLLTLSRSAGPRASSHDSSLALLFPLWKIIANRSPPRGIRNVSKRCDPIIPGTGQSLGATSVAWRSSLFSLLERPTDSVTEDRECRG